MSCQKHPNFCNSSHNSFYVQTAQQVLTIGATFARKFGSKTFQKQCNLVTLYGGDIIIIIIFYSKKILFSWNLEIKILFISLQSVTEVNQSEKRNSISIL